MTFIVATNVIASRPPERRPTATTNARAKIVLFGNFFLFLFLQLGFRLKLNTKVELKHQPPTHQELFIRILDSIRCSDMVCRS